MPQLAKGGKWVYGWVLVSLHGNVTIPTAIRCEYGFQEGSHVIFLQGSKRSGGFSLARAERLIAPLDQHVPGQGQVGPGGQVIALPELGAQPGERLLAVRRSSYGPVFIIRGPICEEALKHPELEIFDNEDRR